MIDRIKKLLLGPSQAPAVARGDPSQAPASARGDEGLKLAAAVLMVEAAWMDQSYDVSERRAIAAALRRHFHLNELETATLIETAERAQANATELSRFAKTIKEGYSAEQRIELIELLWEVVYADGELHDYEDNLMRRIGGLLYVPDHERGAARKSVVERLGLSLEEGQA